MFLWQEFLKTFSFSSKKRRVGFVLDVFPVPYAWVMASTRLRAYDVILYFAQDKDFTLELYRPWRKYDIVIFQKAWRKNHHHLAQVLQKNGTRVILDLNTAVFHIHPESHAFIREVDHLLVSSPYLLAEAQKLFPGQAISLIEEHIPTTTFSAQKNTLENPRVLVYAGYAEKASEILHIQNILKVLREQYSFSLLFLCEKNPKIRIAGIESTYIKYQQNHIYRQILQGDIFLAPRNLNDSINLGHSFTKIGLPMAVGLPVIASPVPAYFGSPALIANTEEEWLEELRLLFSNSAKRKELSTMGRLYCQKEYGTEKIMRKYKALFFHLLG